MNGMIYTFYSYKGGVGRTMALANIALYLFYQRSLNVLMIDWDLEAPGLERYFADRSDLDMRALGDQRGVIDLIQDYQNNISNPPPSKDASPYPALKEHYIRTLTKRGDTSLQLITSGRRGTPEAWQNYSAFVQGFSWDSFYADWAGGGFINWLRDEVRTHADVILIDSRTGMTEMGGVVTQQMADVVVLMFAPNIENMENTLRVARSFKSDAVTALRDGQPLEVLAVASRVDDSDSRYYPEFRERLRSMFGKLLPPSLARNTLFDMALPYLPKFSYRETLLFGNRENEDAGDRLVKGYREIASNMIAFAPEGHIIRRGHDQRGSVFLWYSSLEAFPTADTIRKRLDRERITVQPSFDLAAAANATIDDDERQLETSQCVILLVDSGTAQSKAAQALISKAIKLKKPIIPVILGGDEKDMPIELHGLKHLDWRRTSPPWEDLFASLTHYLLGETRTENNNQQYVKASAKHLYISCSHQDREYGRRLHTDLTRRGFPTFMDTVSIVAGEMWQERIQEALDDAEVFLPVVTSSYNTSSFVKSELAYFQKQSEIQNHKQIIPLRVGGVKIPITLITEQYIDFTDNYEQGFQTLLTRLSEL